MSGLAEATIRATASCPGKTLLGSEGLGWTSLLVHITEFAASIGPLETDATPDPRMVLFLNNNAFVQQFSQGGGGDLTMAKGWATFLHPEPDAVCVGISKIKSRSRLCTCPYLKIRSTQSQARSRTNTALGKINSRMRPFLTIPF